MSDTFSRSRWFHRTIGVTPPINCRAAGLQHDRESNRGTRGQRLGTRFGLILRSAVELSWTLSLGWVFREPRPTNTDLSRL